MASVFLLSAGASVATPDPEAIWDLELIQESAVLDVFGRHRVVEDPVEADLILFVETSIHGGKYFDLVRSHETYRRHLDRCYVYCATDKIIPLIPGVFVSLEARWNWPAWVRPGHYVSVKVPPGAEDMLSTGEPEFLFSFVGSSRSHPVRREVVTLHHPDAQVIDTSKHAMPAAAEGDPPSPWRSFATGIRSSAFVLCPRGGGTATFRLFETMMLGRVPVVISDQWVPPVGPDWERCSIRVPEREVGTIPRLLQGRRDQATEMGRAARETWLEWFSPEVSFHRVVESCLVLHRVRSQRGGPRRLVPWAQLLRPYHTARWTDSWLLGHRT